MTVKVSVVVPTYQRQELLARCLTALQGQTLDPTVFEVIVVDDAACPATRDLVLERAGKQPEPRIKYLPANRTQGPAAARNLGWRAAQGPVIAFTDDDCIPTRSWLETGLLAVTEHRVAVSGQIVVPLPARPTDYELNTAGLEHSEFTTANAFYRREALERAGGFDERFTIAWREDSDLYFTLLKTYPGNGHFGYAPGAVVLHPPRRAAWGVSLAEQRKSRFNALLYKKHAELYSEHLQPVTRWRYYQIVVALLGALLALLLRRRRSATVAATVWALLTGAFCRDRLRNTSHEPKHVAEMVVTSILIPPLSIFWRLAGAIRFRIFFL